MDISKIATGKNPPTDINVLIENPMGGDPIKYELIKSPVRFSWIVFYIPPCITREITVLFPTLFREMGIRWMFLVIGKLRSCPGAYCGRVPLAFSYGR
jgi:hypothetical protein